MGVGREGARRELLSSPLDPSPRVSAGREPDSQTSRVCLLGKDHTERAGPDPAPGPSSSWDGGRQKAGRGWHLLHTDRKRVSRPRLASLEPASPPHPTAPFFPRTGFQESRFPVSAVAGRLWKGDTGRGGCPGRVTLAGLSSLAASDSGSGQDPRAGCQGSLPCSGDPAQPLAATRHP